MSPADVIEDNRVSAGSHRWIWLVVATSLTVILLGAVGTWALVSHSLRISRPTSALTSEWKTRLATDYPGWKLVDFSVVASSTPGSSETDYWATLVPPGQDNSLRVYYVSAKGGPAVSQDEVLRPNGTFHMGAQTLLDYIKRHYWDAHKQVVIISSDSDGYAFIGWVRTGQKPSAANIRMDTIWYETIDNTWQLPLK